MAGYRLVLVPAAVGPQASVEGEAATRYNKEPVGFGESIT
jgi:hypothetical protein